MNQMEFDQNLAHEMKLSQKWKIRKIYLEDRDGVTD